MTYCLEGVCVSEGVAIGNRLLPTTIVFFFLLLFLFYFFCVCFRYFLLSSSLESIVVLYMEYFLVFTANRRQQVENVLLW